MINATGLSKDSQDFIVYLSNGIRPRSPHVTIAIAKVLANRLPVPNGTLESVSNQYNMTCLIEVRRQLSKINELVAVDADAILDYTYKFFSVRYHTVNPSSMICCLNKETALQDFFGLSLALDQKTVEVICENPIELSNIYNKTSRLLTELTPADNPDLVSVYTEYTKQEPYTNA